MRVLLKRTFGCVDAADVHSQPGARLDFSFCRARRLSARGAASRLGEFLVFARAAPFLLTD